MTSTIKVNTIQNTCGADIIKESGNTITIGASGDTVTLGSGASQSGFGRSGSVDWQTTKKTANFTAVSGEGYFCDTTGGAFTLTLPASPSAGDIVALKDYAINFSTANLTIGRNSSNINGVAADPVLNTDGQSVVLVYVDGTKGWIPTQDDTSSIGALFVAATGGTITTCGNFKIHTFTGPGTFTVSCAGNSLGSNKVDYLVVAGGGSGAAKGPGDSGGGGGAGGFRYAADTFSVACSPAEPLKAPTGLSVTATGFPITVGAGGAGNPAPGGPCAPDGNGANGANSIFSTITSTGGGKGGYGAPRCTPSMNGAPGGSGGGGGSGNSQTNPGGTGNTPPVSPPQGKDGGAYVHPASPNSQGGGGGGALVAGCGGSGPVNNGGAGGGLPNGFGCNGVPCGSFRFYAGGGAGGRRQTSNGTGGKGGGGNSKSSGTTNTGGGGGGGGADGSPAAGGSGGSGIVVIRYKFQ